jgi:meiosis induction protein kinase IME2/SME1
MNHEYFMDAVDPLRPKSSALSQVTKKPEQFPSKRDSAEIPQLNSKSSWFRKSLVTKEGAAPAPQVPRPAPDHTQSDFTSTKSRPIAEKRATWTNGVNAAPMPILPTIRPISPLSDAVTAQSHQTVQHGENTRRPMDEQVAKKIGRQLSVASNGNHYAEIHRQEAERALNGNGAPSPTFQKEGFFSHLRKRARRLSGRHQTPLSPPADDIEANAGCGPWSNRSSMAIDSATMNMSTNSDEFKDLDRALRNVRYSVENTTPLNVGNTAAARLNLSQAKRHSLPQGHQTRSVGDLTMSNPAAPISTRTRRALQISTHPVHRYETPDEEEELLDEMVASTQKANTRLNSLHPDRSSLRQSASNIALSNPYPTPSPSAKRNGVGFGSAPRPVDIQHQKAHDEPKWPTPPYDENEWATAAAASIYAAGAAYQ